MLDNSLMPSKAKSVMLRYLFLLSLFSFGLLYATAENNEMRCATEYQENSMGSLWYCPALPNFNTGSDYSLTHELTDVDFETGEYTCNYRYKSGGNTAQSCRYKSGSYERMQQGIKDELYGVTSENEVYAGVFTLYNGTDYSQNRIDLNALFNKVGVTTAPSYLVDNIQPELNNVHKDLKEMLLAILHEKDKELQNTETHLKDLTSVSYRHLVEPYYRPDVKDALKKEGNFANFVAGLVTLNGDMVEGYDERTGELIISNEWKNKALSISATEDTLWENVKNATSTVITYVGEFFTGGVTAESEALRKQQNLSAPNGTGSNYLLSISSWVDIFEMKLWGYYYNLQRRLDIGYDVISTQLLYIMSLWFILLGGTKTGIGHIINREQGFKVTEENWMKGVSMMVGLGVFFISLPSPITSNMSEGEGDITQEMQKNKTVIKYIIRESAQQGSNFATMMSDLGLDAFLSYVVKKQHIYSAEGIASTFQSTVADMSMYYPAYATVEQCRSFYGTTDMDFYNTGSPTTLSVNEAWGNSQYARSNNLSSLSYPLCKKAYNIVGVTPYDMYLTIAETKERIENKDEVMAKAVSQLVTNHILVQDKMGWVNTFNTPVTYFIMKHGDMFLDKGISYDKVESEAKKMVQTLGVSGSENINLSDTSNSTNAFRVGWGATQDTLQGFGAEITAWVSHFAMYNILPGFSSIQKGIQDYLDKVYGDYLEIETEQGSQTGGFIDKVKDMYKNVGTLGVAKLIMKTLVIPPIDNPLAWRSLILFLSFAFAIYAWKLMFTVVFISTVSIMLLLKTVLYFKDLMLHVITSVFVVAWAFAKQGGQGEQKMVHFVRDTLVLMAYPSLIVLSAYTFIFVFEMFSVLYTYLMTMMLEGQKSTVSLMTMANSNTDTFTSYMNISAIGYMSEIIVDIFGLFIATITIMQMPEYILKKLGVSENETMMISANAEKVSHRGEKFSNPL